VLNQWPYACRMFTVFGVMYNNKKMKLSQNRPRVIVAMLSARNSSISDLYEVTDTAFPAGTAWFIGSLELV